MTCIKSIILVCLLFLSCNVAKDKKKNTSNSRDSIVFLYNDYIDDPQSVYFGGWGDPRRESGLISHTYYNYNPNEAVDHYFYTNQGDTITSTQFQEIKGKVQGYNSLLQSIFQRHKVMYERLSGVNLIDLDKQTSYYLLWPTDSTKTYYGRAKLVKWTYYFVETIQPMRIVDGVIIST